MLRRLVTAGLLLATAAAGAQEPPRQRALAAAAARHDAFLNLYRTVESIPVTARTTVAGLLARDPALREGVEAALRGAEIVQGPDFPPGRLVRITIELKTHFLPYGLRSRLRNLPGTLRVDGVADRARAGQDLRVKIGAVAAAVKEWAESDLEAEATAPVARTANPDAAKRAARRQAITDAYNRLAKKIAGLRIDPDVTVGQFLVQHSDVRRELNATLIEAHLVSESLDLRGTKYQVKISLPGRLVMRPLRLGGFRSMRARVLSETELALARHNARQDAVEALRAKIHALPLRTGLPAGKYLSRKGRERTRAAVDQACRMAPIEQIEVTDEGLVKMHVSVATRLLPSELRNLIPTSASRPRVRAIGGGLPIQREKKDDGSQAKPDVLTATGTAAFAAYRKPGRSQAQVIEQAKLGAALAAQTILIGQYARTFLKDDTEIKAFVTKSERIAKRAGGLLKAIRRVKEALTPDQVGISVTVEAALADLRAALGGGKPGAEKR